MTQEILFQQHVPILGTVIAEWYSNARNAEGGREKVSFCVGWFDAENTTSKLSLPRDTYPSAINGLSSPFLQHILRHKAAKS